MFGEKHLKIIENPQKILSHGKKRHAASSFSFVLVKVLGTQIGYSWKECKNYNILEGE